MIIIISKYLNKHTTKLRRFQAGKNKQINKEIKRDFVVNSAFHPKIQLKVVKAKLKYRKYESETAANTTFLNYKSSIDDQTIIIYLYINHKP